MKYPKRLVLWLAILATVLLITGGFWWRYNDVVPPLCPDCNVVLISVTNLRYDHVSSNGYFRQTTPNIDALAQESFVFDKAFSHSSWTLPESLTLYTSSYPYQHGVMDRLGSKLSAGQVTLVDLLKKNNYLTGAFTGGFDYDPSYGLTGRFDDYDGCTEREKGKPSDYGNFSCSVPKASAWLEAHKTQKFYLHVQGFEAHCPFSQAGGKMFDPEYKGKIDYSRCLWTYDKTDPTSIDGVSKYGVYQARSDSDEKIWLGPADVAHLVAIYDESIYAADQEVGKLIAKLKDLGLWEKTIVIVTSEHGDMFGKYGRFMRGGPLRGTYYDDVLHVPMMIRIPNQAAKHLSGLVGQIDYMPTVLGILGVSGQVTTEGISLVPMIKKDKPAHDYVYAGSVFNPSSFNEYFNKPSMISTIRGMDWKLIRETIYLPDGSASTSSELFDLKNDPEEKVNVASQNKKEESKLSNLLDLWIQRIKK